MSKQRITRVLCLMACLLFAVAALAACGSGDESSVTSGGGSSSPASTTGETTNPGEPPLDLNGRVIKIHMFGGETTFLEEEGDYYQSLKDTEERFNCKFEIEVIPILELIESVTQAQLAGDAPFDVAMVEGYHVIPNKAVSKEYLNISDYVDFSKFTDWDYEPIADVGVFKGSRYGLPIGMGSNMGIFYNKAMVRSANLEDPWTYVESDTWNWETFKTFTKALTIPGSGGTPEQFGFVSEEPFYQFALANGGKVIDMSSGSGQFAMGDEKGLEAIDYVMSLYDEKIMPTSQEIADTGIVKAFDGIPSGKVAMFPYGSGYGPYLIDDIKMNKDDVGWVYFPKGPQATDYVAPTLTDQNMFMILANVEKPEEVCRAMIDMMAIWSDTRTEKKTFDSLIQEAATADAYMDFLVGNHKTMYLDLVDKVVCTNTYNYTAANNLIKEMLYEIQTKSMTTAAAITAYKDQIQAEITKLETTE